MTRKHTELDGTQIRNNQTLIFTYFLRYAFYAYIHILSRILSFQCRTRRELRE